MPPTSRDLTPRPYRPGAGLALAVAASAIDRPFTPRAGLIDDLVWGQSPVTLRGNVAVVTICGPLETRGDWWSYGYNDVLAMVRMALADPTVEALVLELDSPGGAAVGMLDTARAIRRMADVRGVPLLAAVSPTACSAAYALACAADRIIIPADGESASIGCVAVVWDRTKANAEEGYDVRVIRSGTLKCNPHPDAPLDDAAVGAVTERVNELAALFAAWVSERRPSAGDPLRHEGAVLYGQTVIDAGLADHIGTLDDAINLAAGLAAQTRQDKIIMDLATKLGAIFGATDNDTIVAKATAAHAAVASLTERAEKAERELAALKSAKVETDRADMIGAALRAGRLTPAMQANERVAAILAGDLGVMGAFLEALPPSPQGVQGAAPAKPDATRGGGTTGATKAPAKIDANQKKLAALAGQTDEEFAAGLAADAQKRAERRADTTTGATDGADQDD